MEEYRNLYGTESGKLDVELTLVIKGDGTGELVPAC